MSITEQTGDILITANAVKQQVRDTSQSHTQTKGTLAQSASMLGDSLGNALMGYLKAEQASFIETKKLDAAARQGQSAAINKVDAEAERTGWKKAIFGQDEGFDVATARAAENVVRDTYMEEATTIDNYAALSPEEYKTRLQGKLTAALEKNPDNKLYRQSVTDAWVKSTEKLAARQFEANTAYNQTTARANADRQIRQDLDIVNIDLQNARTPEELMGLRSDMVDILQGKTLPTSMHPVARRAAVNEAVFSSISQGNIGVYNILKQIGYDKELSGAEQAQLDTALNQYTQDWAYDIATKFEEAELAAINEGTNLEAAKQTWFRLDEELNALKLRSSGTKQADSILARYFSASAGKRSMLDEMKDRLMRQGMKVDKDAVKQSALQLAYRSPTISIAGNVTAVSDTYGPVTKEESIRATDANLLEDISRLAGTPEGDTAAAVSAGLTDPNVARIIGSHVAKSPVQSTIVKRMFENVIGGYTSEQFMDPNTKRPTEQLAVAIGNLRLMASNNAKIPLDKDERIKFGILERGINSMKTIPTIQAEIDSYMDNKELQGVGFTWPGLEHQDAATKSTYIATLVENYGGGTPKGRSLAEHIDIFQEGLTINGNDFDAAKRYLKDFVGNKNLTYRGKTIVGGKRLNDLTGEYPFDATMDWLQSRKDVNGKTMFENYASMIIPPQKVDGKDVYPASLNEVGGWNMKVEEGFDGVVVKFEQGRQPWLISKEQLQKWSRMAAEDRRIKDEKEAAMWDARIEQQEMSMHHYVTGR